ncbi:MAG TPA: GNAT family N-acetyltransferase [Acidobacteriota bacterium]|nr:GNAT family N-acetyltransferase [Acidobacteriota bacterium]HNH83185.1 GNAT family N-acetyltransferase [Acidobacteriota bacterium]HNJ44147.1 GNAT family N-acetyltransferase [Acidobacteriota bacterium]
MPAFEVSIAIESATSPEVIRLIQELDHYLTALYPAESNHLLSISALNDPAVTLLVARYDGKAVGCGALLRTAPGFGEVKRMYVDPNRRGLGLGKKLLAAIEETARQAGIHTLQLETGIHQPEAIGLYIKNGYREIEPFREYQPDPLSRFFERKLG